MRFYICRNATPFLFFIISYFLFKLVPWALLSLGARPFWTGRPLRRPLQKRREQAPALHSPLSFIYFPCRRHSFPLALGPWLSALNKKDPNGSFLFIKLINFFFFGKPGRKGCGAACCHCKF